MEYANLGRTGLKVSRLCLGTMNDSPHASENESHAQMDKAIELGINFFDTADVYGWKKGEGVTEQIIGTWFHQGGRREKVILATKVYGEVLPAAKQFGLGLIPWSPLAGGVLQKLPPGSALLLCKFSSSAALA